jgi:tetratricopeptide (TPR) repeat protein
VRRDLAGSVRLRGALASVALLALLATMPGCGSAYSVVRVRGGQAHAERYVSPDAYAASLEASLAEERGDWAAAAEWLRKARDEDPDAPELPARYGLALCKLGKREAAMFAFGEALRISPTLERAYTARAECRLRVGGPSARAEARADLERAIQLEPTAIEPALLLVDLDVADGALPRARARLEELAILHPSSAPVFRVLAEVAARQGDVGRAVSAARVAGALDVAEGARARTTVLPIADASGVAAFGLAARGRDAAAPVLSEPDPSCAALLARFEQVARRDAPDEIALASQAVRAQCPALDGAIVLEEARATWSPARADALEARALASTSPAARRWALRSRLRRLPTAALLAPGALPAAEDRESLALHVIVEALRRARASQDVGGTREIAERVEAARLLAPAEPTVARLAAETARALGRPADDPWRRWALALARTDEERAACR